MSRTLLKIRLIPQKKSILLPLKLFGGIFVSIWTNDCSIPEREALSGDIRTDVAVVGGGMAGILIAKLLKEKGVDSVVLDADRIAGGNTSGTTAKITAQHRLIYDDLINKLDIERAKQYADANMAAVSKFSTLAEGIDCDFMPCPAYVYSLKETDDIEKEARAAEKLKIQAELTTKTELPFDVTAALRFENQARFHPLKFIRGISGDLTIYEKTRAMSIEDGVITTENGTVTAEKVVVATHFPFINMPGYYFIRMHQERSYVLSLDNVPLMEGMYIDADEKGYSFREYNKQILFGGKGHRTGRNRSGDKYNSLLLAAKKIYLEAIETCRWSAQDCVTQDKIPFIGHYSKMTPDLYVATGFKKWGMTGSMVSAMILSATIAGEDCDFAEVFDPARINLAAAGSGIVEDVKQIARGFTKRIEPADSIAIEDIENGCAAIMKNDGEKIGIYKDNDGEVHKVTVSCPHLGCQLAWNPDELTWDCPCHGSRFSYTGKRIEGPAEVDIGVQV